MRPELASLGSCEPSRRQAELCSPSRRSRIDVLSEACWLTCAVLHLQTYALDGDPELQEKRINLWRRQLAKERDSLLEAKASYEV